MLSRKTEKYFFFAFWIVSLAKIVSNMQGQYPDLWGHVLYGLAHLNSGKIALTDPYSYTAHGLPWINHEWLSELIFAYAWRSTGMTGLWFLRLIMGGTILGLVFFRIFRTAKGFWAGILMALLCSFELTRYVIFRPQLFTAFFFTIFLYIVLEVYGRPKQDQKWLLMLAPLMALWVNAHGGFITGLALLSWLTFCVFVDCLWKKAEWGRFVFTLAAFLLSGAATLLNPYGLGLWRWLVYTLSTPRNGYITEWAPAYLSSPQWGVFVFYLVNVIILYAFVKTRREKSLFEWGLLIVTCFAAWLNIRHEMMFAVIAGMLLPKYLESASVRLGAPACFNRKIVNACVTLCVVFSLSVHFVPGRRPNALSIKMNAYPFNAMRFIRANELRGNLLVGFDWAQAVIWYLDDICKVAYDGRFRTVYPLSVERDYFQFHYFDRAWTNILNQYDTQMILMPADSRSVEVLEEGDEWVLVYREPVVVNPFGNSQQKENSALFIRKGTFPDFQRRAERGEIIYPVPRADFRFGEPLETAT